MIRDVAFSPGLDIQYRGWRRNGEMMVGHQRAMRSGDSTKPMQSMTSMNGLIARKSAMEKKGMKSMRSNIGLDSLNIQIYITAVSRLRRYTHCVQRIHGSHSTHRNHRIDSRDGKSDGPHAASSSRPNAGSLVYEPRGQLERQNLVFGFGRVRTRQPLRIVFPPDPTFERALRTLDVELSVHTQDTGRADA